MLCDAQHHVNTATGKSCPTRTCLILKSARRLAARMERDASGGPSRQEPGAFHMHPKPVCINNYVYCKKFPLLRDLAIFRHDPNGLEHNPACEKPYYQPNWVDGFGEQLEFVREGAEVPEHWVCASNRPSARVDGEQGQEIPCTRLPLPIAADATEEEKYQAQRDQHHALLLRQYGPALRHCFSFDYNRSDMDALVLPTIQYLERHPEIFVSAERHEQRHADLPEENRWLDVDMHTLAHFQDDVDDDDNDDDA